MIRLMHFIGMRNRKTVVLIEDYCFYVYLFPAVFLCEGFRKGHRKVIERRDSMLGKA